MKETERPAAVGRRVVVTGLAGAGKSTFSKALSAKTCLPLIHLDLHFWKPGWVAPSDDEWREKQCGLLAGDAWIADGNYHATLALRVERADTVVYLDTPWWTCARRAFVRGIRRPPGSVMPEGCEDTAWQRLRDEWGIVWRVWRGHVRERERELRIVSQYGQHVDLHVLGSKRSIHEFLEGVDLQPRDAIKNWKSIGNPIRGALQISGRSARWARPNILLPAAGRLRPDVPLEPPLITLNMPVILDALRCFPRTGISTTSRRFREGRSRAAVLIGESFLPAR